MARAQVENVGDLYPLTCEVMNGVSIIPIQPEVRGSGLHGRQAPGNRGGIYGSRRVAVFGDAPYALDGGVLRYQPFHFVHVRAVFPERHGNHANAVVLADLEVPVVAWNGAQEGNLSLLRPRGDAVAGPL